MNIVDLQMCTIVCFNKSALKDSRWISSLRTKFEALWLQRPQQITKGNSQLWAYKVKRFFYVISSHSVLGSHKVQDQEHKCPANVGHLVISYIWWGIDRCDSAQLRREWETSCSIRPRVAYWDIESVTLIPTQYFSMWMSYFTQWQLSVEQMEISK